MARMNDDCPCTKDCPDRSATCRQTCEKGKAWSQKQQQKYEERNKRFTAGKPIESYYRDRNTAIRREVKRRHGK